VGGAEGITEGKVAMKVDLWDVGRVDQLDERTVVGKAVMLAEYWAG
jgi:hypothetical protein